MSSIDRTIAQRGAEIIRTQFVKQAAKDAVFAFAKLADRFREAPRLTRNPSVLKREVCGVLPADAGNLLCYCHDEGMLSFPSHDKIKWKGGAGYHYSEWDLRKLSPSYVRKLAMDLLEDFVKDPHKYEQKRIEEVLEGVKNLRCAVGKCPTGVHLFIHVAGIHPLVLGPPRPAEVQIRLGRSICH